MNNEPEGSSASSNQRVAIVSRYRLLEMLTRTIRYASMGDVRVAQVSSRWSLVIVPRVLFGI
jgi:hypothetical protein